MSTYLDDGEATCGYCDGYFGDLDEGPHWVLRNDDPDENNINLNEVWHKECIEKANRGS